MTLLAIFATLSFLFSVGAYWPYAKSVWQSKSRPTVSTWLSWWIMDLAILAGMYFKDAVAIQMVAYVIGCGIVIGACILRRANLGWKRIDTICMLLVMAAIGLWAVSGDANFAIIMSLIAICIGCVPLFFNVLEAPEREPMLPWALITTGGFFGVAAIPHYTVADALTPIVFFVVQVTFTLLIMRQFRKKVAVT